MPRKNEPAALAAAGSTDSCAARAATQGESTPPPQPRQLAAAPHSATICIVVTETKDRSRTNVETWTRHDDGWRLGAFTPSFASILIDDVIRALVMARDAREGRR